MTVWKIVALNLWYDALHLLVIYSVIIASASLLANFLPREDKLPRWIKRDTRRFWLFLKLVDVVSFFAINWRACLPSLNWEFMGFRLHRVKVHMHIVQIEEE